MAAISKEIVSGWAHVCRRTGAVWGLYLTEGAAKSARTSKHGWTVEDPRLPYDYRALAQRLRGERLVLIAPVFMRMPADMDVPLEEALAEGKTSL